MARNSIGCRFYRSEKYNIIDPYRLDHDMVLEELIKKQSVNRFHNAKACHLRYRDKIIQFIEELAERLEYKESTFHLAVALVDSLYSLYKVENRMVKLVSFMALHLAAKLEENSEKIPELTSVVRLFDLEFTLGEIKHCETIFANILDYKLNLKTPYTFVEYFFSKGVLDGEDLKYIVVERIEDKLQHFEDLVSYFIRIALDSYSFYKYTSIAIATAAISCARKLIGFPVTWTQNLEQLTRVSSSMIENCSRHLFDLVRDSSPALLEISGKRNDVKSSLNSELLMKYTSQNSIATNHGSEGEFDAAEQLKPDDNDSVSQYKANKNYNQHFGEKKSHFLFSFENFN